MTETMGFLPPLSRDRGLAARFWDLLVSGSLSSRSPEMAMLRRAYAVDLWTTEVPVSLHHAILVIGLINLAFIAADWWTFAAQFRFCLPARLALTAALLFLWNPRSASKRVLAGLLLYAATGLMIIWIIVAAGGTASEYSPGLVLLLAGIPILLPVSAMQACLVVGLLLAIYSAIPVLDPDPLSLRELVLHLSFPWAAGFGALIACHRLDAVRFADYCKRHALEVAGEKLRALDEAKSRFIANVNHELRTPLTLLLLPTEELLLDRSGQLTALQREHLEVVRSNAGRLLSLVNDVLAAAAGRTTDVPIEPQSVEIGAILEETLNDIRPLAARKRLTVAGRGFGSVGSIAGDPDRLRRVLLNVLDNAVKFTPPGGTVDVDVSSDERGVQISVRDSGVGFRAADAERIFERFVQLASDSPRGQGGLGLGLAIARDLVRLHRGRIWAESDGLGAGAVLKMWLPRGTTSERMARRMDPALVECPAVAHGTLTAINAGHRQSTAESSGPEAAGNDVRVDEQRRDRLLIVDDNDEMRTMLMRVLSQEFSVRMAASGQEALLKIEEAAPDLVLADIMMEGLSGSELCTLLKSDDRTRGIPLILVTALAGEDDKISGLELGADDYVSKPFRARELLARIRSLLKLRTVQRDLIERNKALEAAIDELNASRRRSEVYSRAVSHDLRSPIAAAGEALRAALSEAPGRTGAALAIVAENLARADRMLVALRSFTRTVANSEDSGEIDLRSLLEDVVAGLALARGGEQLPIQLSVGSLAVRGRPEKLGHVFRNLLDNAVRAVEARCDGKIVVVGWNESGRAILSVDDNGCGIPREMLHAIFEPFRRGPCSRPGNLGLGLALARQIVEEHGGTIEVRSRLGEGSTFRVALPILKEPAADA